MRRMIYLYFLFSGFCALIYEILWTRLFVLVMGGTVYSFTTVLVAFMSGLALGGWLGGRYADRIKLSPLLAYGILEGLIGFYCLLIPYLILALNPVFNWLYPFLFSHHISGLLVRFSCSALILLIPTTLMGATLPILVRYQYQDQEGLGKTTGMLYAINTLGAVAGSFFSGMVLIPSLGLRHTLYFAAAINLVISASILVLRRYRSQEFIPRRTELVSTELPAGQSFRSTLVLAGYALSGAVAMIYQVAWTRALILSLGTTLYVLSLILTAYIAGLAVGALTITPLADRVKRLWLWIGLMELGIGISAWAVVPMLARLPVWMAMAHRPKEYWSWLGMEFLIGMALIFLPTFLMGMLLPLVVRLYAQLRGGVAEAVGEVYAWNTLGAIAGSFLCGFFLIGWLGLRDSLTLACGLSLLIGIIFILGEKLRMIIRASAAVAAVMAGLLFFHFQPGWEPEIINSGPYIYFKDSYTQAGKDRNKIGQALKASTKILFHKEGVEATVSVFELPGGILVLRINGKTDASSEVDMTTQVLTGHLPLLFHPNPKKLAVIGLASGVTLGSALTHPISEATCLEISPEVVDASWYFNSINQRPLEDPRTRLVINDGRYHLEHTPDHYDAIISEPSNPWIGGMGLLFTREFFAQAKTRLNPGGIMTIWIGIYDLDLDQVRMLTRTFISVFPQSTLWESITGGDYLLMGFNGDVDLDYSRLKERLQDPGIRKDLDRVDLETPEKIVSRLMMGPRELQAFSDGGPLHTDDRRQMELEVPRTKYLQTFKEEFNSVIKAFDRNRAGLDQYLGFSNPSDRADQPEIDRFYQAQSWILAAHLGLKSKENGDYVIRNLLAANRIDPRNKWVRENLYFGYYFKGQYNLRQNKLSDAVSNLTEAWQYNPKGSDIPTLAGLYYSNLGKPDQAGKWIEQALNENQKDPIAWMVRGKLELRQGRPELAVESLARAKQSWPTLEKSGGNSLLVRTMLRSGPMDLKAELYYDSGLANQALGNFQPALSDFEQTLAISPTYSAALLEQGKILLGLGRIEESRERLTRMIQAAPRNADAHYYLGQALRQMPEQSQEALAEYQTYLRLAPADSPERLAAKKAISELSR